MQRVQDLGGSVLDQLAGADPAAEKPNRMAGVPVEARAFAGKIQAQSITPTDQSRAPRYVVGSIVAKPKDIPDMVEMAAVLAEPETAEDFVITDEAQAKIIIPDERTIEEALLSPEVIDDIQNTKKKKWVTVVDPRQKAPVRALGSSDRVLPRAPLKETVRNKRVEQGLEAPMSRSMRMQLPSTPEERMAMLPKMDPKVAARALVAPNAALQRQLKAEDKMIEAAAKFKVAASIQRSRSGQMVIEIGADALNPTSFSGAVLQQGGRVAIESDVTCDEAAALEGTADTLVAMECVIQDLEASGEFEYVEKDYIVEHQMIRRPGNNGPVGPVRITPNDPLFDLQWHYKTQGTGTDASPGGAGFVDFWTTEASQGSNEVVVAVIDTGLQLEHPDIKDSPNVVPGWDMVTDIDVGNDGDSRDSNPNDPGDICPERNVFANTYHGTHVAGIVGAAVTNNSDGIAGGAWNVKIVPVRALGKCGGRISDISDAIRWAAGTAPEFDEFGEYAWNKNPADIINLSIGLFKACPRSLQSAIDEVTAQGVVVVSAAGNDRVPTEYYTPAGCRNVVTVAGGDARGYLAPYSNYGEGVDILAPGGDLGRDDDGDGNPDGVLSTKTAENCADPLTGEAVATCYYAYEQGTSMATPHVSAALALIKSKRPELTATELVSTLMSGVSSIDDKQCEAPCSQYPGTIPSETNPDMCLRPCGSGQLNLANISLPE